MTNMGTEDNICRGGDCEQTCPIFNLGTNLGAKCLTPVEILEQYRLLAGAPLS